MAQKVREEKNTLILAFVFTVDQKIKKNPAKKTREIK